MKKLLSISKKWTPTAWKSLPIKQSPNWPIDVLDETVSKLESFPPLVPIHEIDNLRAQFKRVSKNKAFINIVLFNSITKLSSYFKWVLLIITKQIQFILPQYLIRLLISLYIDYQYLDKV